MEEQGGNLADETTEMMSETVEHQNEELRKRRSTRIMQAVPLAVTGVDALGRPFTERTSTLIINCHGCRYQSKHYVLKNMWVTLEVPHPEAGQAARTVRGRVAWIQRPRTVRQLFQVALELEVPGNTWGIAFPPPDWFAPKQAENISAGHEVAQEFAAKTPETAEIHLPLTEPEAATAQAADNLRMFPAPASATDASLQLARHMARLVADAKQQIQAAAREVAAQAVAAERRVSLEEWEQKFSIAREQLAQQVQSAIEKIQEETEARSRTAHAAAAEALQKELPRWIAPQLEELTRHLTQQISDRGIEERGQHAQQLAGATESLRALCQQAEESVSRLRAQAEQAENQIASRTAESLSEVEEITRQNELTAKASHEALSAAASEIQEQVKAALRDAQNSSQGQIQNEIEGAQARWKSALEASLNATLEKAQAGLDEHVRGVLAQVREEIEQQGTAVREGVSAAATEAAQRIETLRNSLKEEAARHSAEAQEITAAATASLRESVDGLVSQVQEEASRHSTRASEIMSAGAAEAEQRIAGARNAAQEQSQRLENALGRAVEASDHLEHFPARIGAAQEQALAGFESQIGDVLNLHRNELHRQSETLLEELNGRIRNKFEEQCQLAISRFDQQIDAMVQPHISRTEQAIHRLAGGRSLLDAAMTLQQDRIRAAADEAFAESLARFRENLGGVDELLQEAASTVAARNLTEIESKASDLKHQTIDDLLKSAEWYEKKAQTQIQNWTDKTVEQAGNQFREKAGEVSSVFASELDHSSRSFIGHTQTQMEEVVRDAFEHARALFAEAADTTTAAFTDEIQRQARQELAGFNEESQNSLSETRVKLEAARAELSQRVTSEQEMFLREFRSRMTGAVEAGVADAKDKVQAGMSPLLDAWRSTVDTHRTQLGAIYAQLSNLAAEQHRSRLENVSNQWMLATVASLDHQSREAVSSIAAKAEEKLRETCSQVFAGVGDALRERLQQIAASLMTAETPISRSTTAGGKDR
jgi:hypothetical protein